MLLHGVQRGDAIAVGRWYHLDSLVGSFQPRLADAQYVVAREYGFKSWQKLKDKMNIASPSSVRAKRDFDADSCQQALW
jgi:hypothetical protein